MKTNALKSALILATTLSLTACNGISALQKSIDQLGYIYNGVPLATGGPGTIVGGAPHSLQIISDSETCFPAQMNGSPTNLYRKSAADVADVQKSWSVSANLAGKVMDYLNSTTPLFKVGIGFNHVGKMNIKMRGVSVEYIDSIDLQEFYETKMSSRCKSILNQYGLIMQALKVTSLEFTFIDKSGAEINLDSPQLSQIADLSSGVKYSVENNTSLVIDSPRFIGYQLGKAQEDDHGMTFFRASKVKNKQYLFEDTRLFHMD